MDATNAELYRLALTDAPYVIWAYGIIWFALAAYVTVILRRLFKIEKEITVLTEAVETKNGAKIDVVD